jgi:hypothetical protein
MSDPKAHDFVHIDVAKTPFEARVVAVILRDAGIPTMVDETLLQDEFAVSQQLMNTAGSSVSVPRAMVEDAHRALAAAKATASERLTEATSPSPPGPTTRQGNMGWGFAALWFCLAALFFMLWMGARERLEDQSSSNPLIVPSWEGDSVVYRWVHNGELHQTWDDADRDGIAEVVAAFNRDGVLVSKVFDADEDGSMERAELYHPSAGLVGICHDRDRDGFWEEWIQIYPDSSRSKWTDADGDGVYEVREFFDAAGKSLFVEEDRRAAGFVRR